MAEVKSYDVVVNGAGVAGLTLAMALAQNDFRVAVVDPKPLDSTFDDTIDLRVRAINQSSINIFKHIGVWQAIPENRFGYFDSVTVWQHDGEVNYDASMLQYPFLSAIIEEKILLSALFNQLRNEKRIDYFQAKARHLKDFSDSVFVLLDNGVHLKADLLVGADGANSWVRQEAGIGLKTKSYGQSGLVATIYHKKPHQHCARQRFLETGPLVFLPLSEPNTSSIVWSLPNALASEYIDLDETVFNNKLEAAFESRLGQVLLKSDRADFPLLERLASDFVKPHIALVSDAAHTMHPLAGLGLNLGLMDVATLLDVLLEARALQQPIGHLSVLSHYERLRAWPVMKMQKSMAAFKRLFGHEDALLDLFRNKAMQLTETQMWLKRFLLLEAETLERSPPSLARV